MMKKMLTIATAALVLSACGSDAPSVEEASTSTTDYSTTVTPEIQEIALDRAWDSMDDEQQHSLCGMFVRDIDYFMETMDPASMDLTRNQVTDFFAKKCF